MSNNQIVIIDYNLGNLRSVQKAFEKVGCNITISNDFDIIKKASKIVLPGVGSFCDGMKNLKEMGLIGILNEQVIKNKKPFLGVCLGMQLISNKGYENGETDGLGWIDAEVVKFDFEKLNVNFKTPHVGWNNVNFKNSNKLYNGIANDSDFYFVHSCHFKTPDKSIVSSVTDYGFEFVSSINKDNIFAFQFHPEKSQNVGLKLIQNFIKL